MKQAVIDINILSESNLKTLECNTKQDKLQVFVSSKYKLFNLSITPKSQRLKISIEITFIGPLITSDNSFFYTKDNLIFTVKNEYI